MSRRVSLPRAISVDDPATERALSAIREEMPAVAALNGVRLLEGIQLTAGQTKRIAHGLGRKLRGWLVVRINLGASLGYIYDNQSTVTDGDVYLHLTAEGYSPKVSLLVF